MSQPGAEADALRAKLRDLGAAVADASDRAADAGGSAAARARQGFVTGAATPRVVVSPWRTRARAAAFAAAACLAAAGVWKLASSGAHHATAGSTSLTFSIAADAPGVPAVPGVVGEQVAAGVGATREARFSDGSALQLSPGARMRVTTTSPAGAEVLIERGAVHVAVKHREAAPTPTAPEGTTRWAVRAGPFEVHVTGTTFDAAWDPMAERFELTMIEGRVLVSGPSLPPERAVVAGERLIVSVRDGKMMLVTAVTTGSPAAVPPGDPTVAPATSAVPEAPPSGAAALPAAAKPSSEASVSKWRELAASGRYRDAFAAAEAAGFSQEVERAPVGDLWILADAARYAGNAGRAREALLAARRRFGASGQSAFLLGKIAADQQGSPGEAVTWFETYLREQPGGPLAEQALGRVVDLTRRSSPDAARQAAARYLARYPDGSYAALARSLVPSSE